MVKRTLEVFECDKCGNEGQRYSVTFPEGTLVLDRCETHAKKIEALRNEAGDWVTSSSMGRNNFKKSSLVELRQAVETARRNPQGRDDEPEGNVRRI